MTDTAADALARLDERIVHLQQALDEHDWERLAALNGDVRTLIDPVMVALEARQLTATEVQQRLRALERFVDEADLEARQVRADAKEAMDQVGRNRKAAGAYARVSGRRE